MYTHSLCVCPCVWVSEWVSAWVCGHVCAFVCDNNKHLSAMIWIWNSSNNTAKKWIFVTFNLRPSCFFFRPFCPMPHSSSTHSMIKIKRQFSATYGLDLDFVRIFCVVRMCLVLIQLTYQASLVVRLEDYQLEPMWVELSWFFFHFLFIFCRCVKSLAAEYETMQRYAIEMSSEISRSRIDLLRCWCLSSISIWSEFSLM